MTNFRDCKNIYRECDARCPDCGAQSAGEMVEKCPMLRSAVHRVRGAVASLPEDVRAKIAQHMQRIKEDLEQMDRLYPEDPAPDDPGEIL